MARNTPAYAGKTFRELLEYYEMEKHPRVCGEDHPGQMKMTTAAETPPRMRGRPGVHVSSDAERRNTPAYAGKTHKTVIADTNKGKHPRVCGED